MAVYLASRECEVTHQNFSAGAGRFSRVFIGLSNGWLAEPGTRPEAEDIAERLDKISATEQFSVPESIFDEVAEICERRGMSLVPA
jgi:hypothetical protein